MQHRCPACQRSFEEPGFCPYDGKKLEAAVVASTPTVLSAFVEAQVGADQPSELATTPDEPGKFRAYSAS